MPSLGHDPDFRSGFKTFLMDTIGDASIAYAILRNGYSTPEALLALVREIYGDEHAGSRESYLVCKSRQAKVHPDLGAAAEKARREYAAGKNLKYGSENYTRKYDTLNSKEQDILQRFRALKIMEWKQPNNLTPSKLLPPPALPPALPPA